MERGPLRVSLRARLSRLGSAARRRIAGVRRRRLARRAGDAIAARSLPRCRAPPRCCPRAATATTPRTDSRSTLGPLQLGVQEAAVYESPHFDPDLSLPDRVLLRQPVQRTRRRQRAPGRRPEVDQTRSGSLDAELLVDDFIYDGDPAPQKLGWRVGGRTPCGRRHATSTCASGYAAARTAGRSRTAATRRTPTWPAPATRRRVIRSSATPSGPDADRWHAAALDWSPRWPWGAAAAPRPYAARRRQPRPRRPGCPGDAVRPAVPERCGRSASTATELGRAGAAARPRAISAPPWRAITPARRLARASRAAARSVSARRRVGPLLVSPSSRGSGPRFRECGMMQRTMHFLWNRVEITRPHNLAVAALTILVGWTVAGGGRSMRARLGDRRGHAGRGRRQRHQRLLRCRHRPHQQAAPADSVRADDAARVVALLRGC